MGALYMECSSKEMTGVHEIFETAINTVVAEQEGLLAPVESNRMKSSGGVTAKREGVTSSGSGVSAGNTGAQHQQQQPMLMAPSKKKKKRAACLIL